MKNKFIKRLFSIILVMVTIISSSSLLFACTITEYVGQGRVVFTAKELDESTSNTKSRIKDLKDNCFGAVATAMINKLVDYFGPEANQNNQITPNTTRAIVNLNPEYDNNMVELQQILSTMTNVVFKKYNEGTNREVIVLGLSNYPLCAETTQNRISLEDLFIIDNNGVMSFETALYYGYVNGSSPVYKIDGTSANWAEIEYDDIDNNSINLYDNATGAWQGSHVFLHQHRSIGYFDFYPIDENRPVNKMELFFVGKTGDRIAGSSYSFDTPESIKEMLNALYSSSRCNAMHKDHREITNLASGDSVLTWNMPLSIPATGEESPQPINLFDINYSETSPLFDAAKAKEYYTAEYKDQLVAYLVKEYVFGSDGEESSTFNNSNLTCINNSDATTVFQDQAVTYAQLYDAVCNGGSFSNGNKTIDCTGNYALFTEAVLYNVYTPIDLDSFEYKIERIIRNKVIGIEDAGLPEDEEDGPFYKDYDGYVTGLVVTKDEGNTQGTLHFSISSYSKNYKASVSKVYCPSERDKADGYSSNNVINRVTMADNEYLKGKSLNSVIVYASCIKSKTNVDNAFEGDSESEKEFKEDYNSSDFDGTYDFNRLFLYAYVSSDQELKPSYPVVVRTYLHDSSGVKESVFTINLVRQGDTNHYAIDYTFDIRLGASKHYIPLGYHSIFNNFVGGLGSKPETLNTIDGIKKYLLDLSNNTKLSQYGSGFYYKGISTKSFLENFVEFIFPSSAETGDLTVTLDYLIIT